VGHLRNWRRPSSLSGQETQQNVLPNKEEIKKEMVNIPNKTVSAEYITEILSSFVRPHTLSLSLSLSLSSFCFVVGVLSLCSGEHSNACGPLNIPKRVCLGVSLYVLCWYIISFGCTKHAAIVAMFPMSRCCYPIEYICV